MTLPDLALCAFILATPLAAIYLADQHMRWVERRWDAWLNTAYYWRLRWEEFLREKLL